ncbi:MAG: NfeD family protein [Planctomycetota bacterium]|nr:NfeD family protein [Planctomycetota bacterium]MDA1113787.1 NfeD family protein [Planctomycetota bacterium]
MNPQELETAQTSAPTFWEDFFSFLSADSLQDLMSWEFWLVVTIVLLAGEILTAGFLLGALTPGSILAAACAGLGFGMYIQLTAFVVGTLGGLIYLRPIFMRKVMGSGVPSNVGALVGAVAEVTEAISGTSPGRVKVVSEEWRARSNDEMATGARVRVLSVEGNTLIVGPVE